MKYNTGVNKFENWILSENEFSSDKLAKSESVMSLGNGYMGVRSSTEERYIFEERGIFVAGVFNRFDKLETSELVNFPDLVGIDMRVDGESVSLEFGEILSYEKSLNLKSGELNRNFIWKSKSEKIFKFNYSRFASLEDKHLLGSKLKVECLSNEVRIDISSGINGQITNSSTQHFSDGEKRIFDSKYMQLSSKTTQSNIDIVVTTNNKLYRNKELIKPSSSGNDKRTLWLNYGTNFKKNESLIIEKISNIYTSNDSECKSGELSDIGLARLKDIDKYSYDELLSESAIAWDTKVWNKYGFYIESENAFDILALRFAIYHLVIMTPTEDQRCGIGAKGLSGKGYKGHSFWDTEIFILPFFLYSNPKVARNLLIYRYLGLEGAKRKAIEYGYEGAMYPWETANSKEGEVTPKWGDIDMITGNKNKIWTGIIEQHITADIAYSVNQYYKISNDNDFMINYGYEILFETAKFWISRVELSENGERYVINNVIGPDEYKEHVDNNAFTNYMVLENLKVAEYFAKKIINSANNKYSKFITMYDLNKLIKDANRVIKKLYIPIQNNCGIIPQDDSYLSKKITNLEKYKKKGIGAIFEDYNSGEINNMQISKQADIMILFYLLEDRFTNKVKKDNFDYYEPKTLHDSSLSLSTYCILANDLGYKNIAYDLFEKASRIDLGEEYFSSVEGIHAASTGGIWQCVVNGFAGVRILENNLYIKPKLPDKWGKLNFNIIWKGITLYIRISKKEIEVIPSKKIAKESIFINDVAYNLAKQIIVNY
ncbi:glycosyl hydrolase family 65 protein [uncultured Clostridium sp.]|jgi:hypothetical glycosyl hydrolase|uniref:glycoside hydrolase family 65 protein n=1 Tax=uncultured Clostridium sp. TaxID=59620 RepID=UPI002615F237|nr:glycosyl hydrolase family 65 protein [uncultured Clostridium sp.]